MTNKPQLLASAGTLEDIGALIARFYGGEAKPLRELGSGIWELLRAEGKDALKGVRVVLRAGRYRFEMLA